MIADNAVSRVYLYYNVISFHHLACDLFVRANWSGNLKSSSQVSGSWVPSPLNGLILNSIIPFHFKKKNSKNAKSDFL